MTERRAARRYDLSLTATVRPVSGGKSGEQQGTTRDVSTRGVYLLLDRPLRTNGDFDLTMVLPTVIPGGPGVFVRAVGKVVRVDEWSKHGSTRSGVAAVIRRYEIIRGSPQEMLAHPIS